MCFITMYIKTIPLGLQVCNYLFFLQVLSSKKWGKLWFDVFVYNTKVKDSVPEQDCCSAMIDKICKTSMNRTN